MTALCGSINKMSVMMPSVTVDDRMLNSSFHLVMTRFKHVSEHIFE